jgi:hypothetical protein
MGTCPSKPGQLDGVGIGPVIPANQGVNAKKNNSASKGISGPVIPVNKGINSKKNPSNNKPKVLSEREQIQKRIKEIEEFLIGSGQDAQYSLSLQGERGTLESEKKKLEQRLKDLTTGIPVPIGPEENEKPKPEENNPTMVGGKKSRKTKRKDKKQKKHSKK